MEQEKELNKNELSRKDIARGLSYLLAVLSVLSLFNIIFAIGSNELCAIFKNPALLSQVTVCFITAVGSYLVYTSFMEQVKFNEITIRKLEEQDTAIKLEAKKQEDLTTFDRITDLINDLQIQLKNFEYYTIKYNDKKEDYDEVKIKGYSAFSNLIMDMGGNPFEIENGPYLYPALLKLDKLLLNLFFTTSQILDFKSDNTQMVQISKNRFSYTYSKYEYSFSNLLASTSYVIKTRTNSKEIDPILKSVKKHLEQSIENVKKIEQP